MRETIHQCVFCRKAKYTFIRWDGVAFIFLSIPYLFGLSCIYYKELKIKIFKMRLSVQVWMESGGRNRPFLEHHPLDSLKENFKVGDSVSLNMRRLEGHIKYKSQVYFSDAESVRTRFSVL